MLPGEQAFLDRIVAHPDDATARLVYADWLEENGDPDRARFLRYKTAGLSFLDMPENDMRKVRGHHMAMIFQDPMTSLNPVLTIGVQLIEPLMLHLNLTKEEARQRARRRKCRRVGRLAWPPPGGDRPARAAPRA